MRFSASLFLFNQFVTILAKSIFTFFVSIYILRETQSGILFGVSLAISYLPQLLISPFGGYISDTFTRKKIIIATNMLNIIILCSVFAFSHIIGFNILHILVLIAMLAIFDIFNAIALNASIPNIFSGSDVQRIISLRQSIASLSKIIAPFMGALLALYIDLRIFLVVKACLLLIATFAIAYLKFNSSTSKCQKNKENLFVSIKEGLLYAKNNDAVFVILIFMVFMNFVFHLGYTVPIPHLINSTYEMSVTQFGWVQSMASVGGLLAALFFATKVKNGNLKKSLISSTICMSLVLTLMGVVAYMYIVEIISNFQVFIFITTFNLMFGATIVLHNIPLNIILLLDVDDKYRGRIQSIASLCSIISPVALVLSGAIVDIEGMGIVLPIFSGGALLLLTIMLSKNKKYQR